MDVGPRARRPGLGAPCSRPSRAAPGADPACRCPVAAMNLETMRIHSKAPLPGTEPLPRRRPFNPFLLGRFHGGFQRGFPRGPRLLLHLRGFWAPRRRWVCGRAPRALRPQLPSPIPGAASCRQCAGPRRTAGRAAPPRRPLRLWLLAPSLVIKAVFVCV